MPSDTEMQDDWSPPNDSIALDPAIAAGLTGAEGIMEDIAEIMESQFVFCTPIFMYNVLISDSLRSPTVPLPF
jgi:hypothetical protein